MTFADAALKYSKDYLSGANGGSLGYAFPEAYVGPFAKMVETTHKVLFLHRLNLNLVGIFSK